MIIHMYIRTCTYKMKISTTASRMPSIVGERERASWNNQMLILNDSLTYHTDYTNYADVQIFGSSNSSQSTVLDH